MRRLLPVLSCAFAAAAICLVAVPVRGADAAEAAAAKARAAALDSVTAEELREHVERLADDTFEGREAGSRGGHAAGNYLRDRLVKAGLAGGAGGGSYFQSFGAQYRNILGFLEGSDPQLKDEVILIGAHYDHVGYGNRSNSYGPVGYIHNGADDNASGTAGLLEAVDAIAKLEPRPRRSILFALWDGEEKGLLGSEHWATHPTIPLKQIKLAVNMDMIGRLRRQGLEVAGIRSAAGLRELVARGNQGADVAIDFTWENASNSDHYTFFQRSIPYLMLHTGLHDDYHRPSDDADKINADGMQQVTRLLVGLAMELADADALPPFRTRARQESVSQQLAFDRGLPPAPGRLGVVWDPDDTGSADGVTVTRVVPDSAAAKAGIRPGDRIRAFGSDALAAGVDLRELVVASPKETMATIEREGADEPLELPLELAGKPLRLGITWRLDDAEPGVAIVSRVVPGSAADRAGVKLNDRILNFGGQTFTTSQELGELVAALEGPVAVTLERGGHLLPATVELPALLQASEAITVARPVNDESEDSGDTEAPASDSAEPAETTP